MRLTSTYNRDNKVRWGGLTLEPSEPCSQILARLPPTCVLFHIASYGKLDEDLETNF